MRYKKIVLDLETTGLNALEDEILQVSAIDQDGNTLIDEYCKPENVVEWTDAQRINNISPNMVNDKKPFKYYSELLIEILNDTEEVIIFNAAFELAFLNKYGIEVKTKIYDLMIEFAEEYGDYNEYYRSYKWKSLDICCQYYGYTLNNAHNSLEDCKATLYCYNKLINSEGPYLGKDHIGKTVKEFINDVLNKVEEESIYLRIRHRDKDLYDYVRDDIKGIEDIKYKSLLDFKIRDIVYFTSTMYILYVDKCYEAELDIKEEKIENLQSIISILSRKRDELVTDLNKTQTRVYKLERENRKLKEKLGTIEKPKISVINSYGYYTAEYCKSTRKPMFKSRAEYRPFANKLLSKSRCKQIKMPVADDEEIYAFYKVQNGYCALYFRDI